MKRLKATIARPAPVERWLSQQFPCLEAKIAARALKNRDVKRAGVRLSRGDIIFPGDELDVYIDEKHLAVPFDVLFFDGRVLIADKPVSLPTLGEGDTLTSRAAIWASERGLPPPQPAHRLDAMTGGVTAFAIDPAALDALTLAFRERRAHKTYLALVFGLPGDGGHTAYALRDESAARTRVCPSPRPGARTMITVWRTLAVNANRPVPISLVEVTPRTGRTHQIRAHMAYLGFPLVGDDRYGDRALSRDAGARSQALWAASLSFDLAYTALASVDGIVFRSRAVGFEPLARKLGAWAEEYVGPP